MTQDDQSDVASTEEPPKPVRRRWSLRGGPPTEPLPIVDLLHRSPYRQAVQSTAAGEDRSVREALDLAARVGELMLRCGAGALKWRAASWPLPVPPV